MLSVIELVLCTCSYFISVFSFTRKCCKAMEDRSLIYSHCSQLRNPSALRPCFQGNFILQLGTRHHSCLSVNSFDGANDINIITHP